MSLLRSWLKQERLASRNSSWGVTLRFAIVLVSITLALEVVRRIQSTMALESQRQSEQVELLQWIATDTNRSLLDWAHWDDIFDFVEGRDPDFFKRDMETSGLLDGGAVMAILDGRDQLSRLSGAESQDRVHNSPLTRCLSGVAMVHRRSGQEPLQVVCPSHIGPLVGGITTITNTAIEKRTPARFAYLVPLLEKSTDTTLQRGLRDLSRQLVFDTPSGGPQPKGLTAISPAFWSGDNERLMIRQPAIGAAISRELLAIAALASSALLITLGLRMQWMLMQRRQHLIQLSQKRFNSQRIRRTERELNRLLETVQVAGEASESAAFASLLRRQSPLPTGNGEGMDQLAERFEHVFEKARSLALIDGNTNLPNRSYFIERLNWESERSLITGKPLALLFINIDKFKQINETYGHNTGDAVLQHVARELEKLIEPGDFLARFGSDEFSLILGSGNAAAASEQDVREQAHQRAIALLDRFQRSAYQQPEQIKLSLSIGIAVSDSEGTTAEELIRRSERAMVMAKTRRQGRVTVFDLDGEWDELNNYRLYNALQSDISHQPERFVILFQPIVDPQGRPLKVEALCRWSNPDFPDIPAEVLFAVAERHRLMPELGRLLLQQTLRGMVQLRRQTAREDLELAINVSPSQLSRPSFGTELLAQLSMHRLSPEAVTVEITESAVVETGVDLTENLEALRRAGVKLALDDFGTGYSSLRLLLWLRPDELKIDKSFVMAALADPVAMEIVNLLQAFAAQTNLLLIAEGVESQSMLDLLIQAGLKRFQGYLFHKPLGSAELATRIAAETPRGTASPA